MSSNTFGGTVKLDGESEYRKALSNITAQMKVMSTEMAKVTAEFGKNDNSVESLAKKESILTERLDIQKKKVETLRGALEHSKELYGENDTKTLKWQASLNKAESEVIKTAKEIDSLGNNLEEAGASVEKSSDGFTIFKGVLTNLATDAIRGAINGVKNLGSTIINIGKQAITSYADYEQLIGGVETLFKDSAGTVQTYANNAYKTSGLSANEYMETVTSFSASLLQSLNGDTAKSAEVADMAITDMSDNANKMGTSMESIQTAYQGFAKQNYTMLDNLKLGYGGTKSEMERLLSDAQKISGVKYDISNLNDVYQAIHVIQGELGITGTTAKEASTTISGSISSWKSSYSNLLTGIADDNADFNSLINNFVDSTMTVMDNLLPRIHTAIEGMGDMVSGLIKELFPKLVPIIVDSIAEMTPTILDALSSLLTMIVSMTPQLLQTAIQMITELAVTIGEQLPTLIPLIIQALIDMSNALLDNIDLIVDAGIQLIIGLADGCIVALPILIEKLPEIIDKFIIALSDNMPKLVDAGITITIKLAEGLIKAAPQLISKIPQIINSLLQGFSNYYSKMGEIGLNLVKGIWSGISNSFEWIKTKLKEWVGNVTKFIKKLFGIHSPSTLFRDEIGTNLALGLGEGFVDEMDSVKQSMASAIPTKFDVDLKSNLERENSYYDENSYLNNKGYLNKTNESINITINNNSKYTSPSENARLIRKELQLYKLKKS